MAKDYLSLMGRLPRADRSEPPAAIRMQNLFARLHLRALKPAFIAGAFVAAMAPAQVAAQHGEYEVKAAFLYNIARFVEWPQKVSPSSNATSFHMCVYGKNPFAGALEAIKGKEIGGKKIIIQHINPLDHAQSCQMLFISASEQNDLKHVISGLSDHPVLTIGDTPGYARNGVIVNFYLEQNKVRFEINIQAAKQSGLKVSSKLLALAKII